MTKINTGNANREYKDRLFRFVFGAEENKVIYYPCVMQ